MRRRIYIAPDGSGLEDVTDRPYRYDRTEEIMTTSIDALYDEPIWQAYLAAQQALRMTETAVIAHLRSEPYDAVELQAAKDAHRLLDDESVRFTSESMEEIVARVVMHAQTKIPK